MPHKRSSHKSHARPALTAMLLLSLLVLLLAGCGSPSWTNISGSRFNSSSSFRISGLTFSSTRDVLFTGYGESVWRCAKPATSVSWTGSTIGSDSSSVSCIAYDPGRDILYAEMTAIEGPQGKGVWRCSSASTSPSWSSSPIGLSTEIVSCLTFDPTQNVLYAGASGTGVWFCTTPDASASWTSAGGDFNGTSVDAIAYDASRDMIYVGTSGTGVRRCTSPRTSPTWLNISDSPIASGSNGISSLVYDSTHNVLYAGTYQAGGIVDVERGGVWRCADPESSPSWTDTGALSSYYVNSLAFDSDRDILYAGTDHNSVWRCTSPRTSPSWTNTGGKLTSFQIKDLALDTTHNLLYAAGDDYRSGSDANQGVWRYKP